MSYSGIYNPNALNSDDIGKVHDSSDRNKYPLGSIVTLKERYQDESGNLETCANGIYMWVEATENFDKGVPFLIVPGGLQSEAKAIPLLAQESGGCVGFAQVDNVTAGKYFFAKISGHISDVDSEEGVSSGEYVKLNLNNETVEQGDGSGAKFYEEIIGVATSSESENKVNIVVNLNRVVKIAESEE